jgi:hypothetical protein
LQPIFHLTARLLAAFEIDFVGPATDLSSRAGFSAETPPVPGWMDAGWGSLLTCLFGFADILISLFPVIGNDAMFKNVDVEFPEHAIVHDDLQTTWNVFHLISLCRVSSAEGD